jgi:hypothetical protein
MSIFLSLFGAMFLIAAPARAVYLDPDGTGQVLIYPYYTAQSSSGSAYNTLLSVTNTAFDTKVVKVRFREGRNGLQVLDFNIYLGGGDMWTAAIVANSGGGASIVSHDASCTNPPLPSAGQGFTNVAFVGSPDGLGGGAERTLEGYFEMFEMATLTGAPADAVNLDSSGKRNCAGVQAVPANLGTLGPPTGGLSGNATLINVVSGLDVTYQATALSGVASRAMYGDPGSSKPDYDSPEVDPIASIVTGNTAYRLVMSSGFDAMDAVLRAIATDNEYVLDSATASKTDWVETHPLRRFYVPGAPTFSNYGCADPYPSIYDRDQSGPNGIDFPERPPSGYEVCWASTVFSIRKDTADTSTTSDVLVSRNTLTQPAALTPVRALYPAFYTRFPNGWISVSELVIPSVNSMAGSSMTNLATGAVTTGSFRVEGTPTVGFVARTFVNANVMCGSTLCQATYSAAMPHRRIRMISPNS